VCAKDDVVAKRTQAQPSACRPVGAHVDRVLKSARAAVAALPAVCTPLAPSDAEEGGESDGRLGVTGGEGDIGRDRQRSSTRQPPRQPPRQAEQQDRRRSHSHSVWARRCMTSTGQTSSTAPTTAATGPRPLLALWSGRRTRSPCSSCTCRPWCVRHPPPAPPTTTDQPSPTHAPPTPSPALATMGQHPHAST
jgi:hypothetical protein